MLLICVTHHETLNCAVGGVGVLPTGHRSARALTEAMEKLVLTSLREYAEVMVMLFCLRLLL